MRENYTEIEELYDLRQLLSQNETIRHCAFQAVNFEKCGFPHFFILGSKSHPQ